MCESSEFVMSWVAIFRKDEIEYFIGPVWAATKEEGREALRRLLESLIAPGWVYTDTLPAMLFIGPQQIEKK